MNGINIIQWMGNVLWNPDTQSTACTALVLAYTVTSETENDVGSDKSM